MEDQNKIIIEVDEGELDSGREARKYVRVLAFRLGDERYAIEISNAKEVFKVQAVTKMPNAPQFIVGVTNLHGEVIPLIDISYFLGLSRKEGLGGTKAIVTDVSSGGLVGIVVDAVDKAIDIEEEAIQPPLATVKGKIAAFTKGQVELAGDIVVLLELRKVLSCEEIESLKKGL